MKTIIRKHVMTVCEMARLNRAALILFSSVKIKIYGEWNAADKTDAVGELVDPEIAFLNGGCEVVKIMGKYSVKAIIDGDEQFCRPYELPFMFEFECE